MKRLLYAAVLAIVVGIIFAPAALAQNATCADFNGDQAAAQRALPQNPQLDRNKDGIACNDLLRQGQQPAAPQVTPQDAQQPAAPQPTPQAETTTTPQPAPQPQAEATGQLMEAGGNLPATGGPALLLPAAALLVGSGLLVVAVRRRG